MDYFSQTKQYYRADCYAGVVGDASCELPAGWDKVASENWRALQEEISTRKFLCSNLRTPNED